jgi:hypothetical protein
MPLPLQVILSILGVPEDDYPRMLQVTQQIFGSGDAEMSRGVSPEEMASVFTDLFNYFNGLATDRQANPTDDLASERLLSSPVDTALELGDQGVRPGPAPDGALCLVVDGDCEAPSRSPRPPVQPRRLSAAVVPVGQPR